MKYITNQAIKQGGGKSIAKGVDVTAEAKGWKNLHKLIGAGAIRIEASSGRITNTKAKKAAPAPAPAPKPKPAPRPEPVQVEAKKVSLGDVSDDMKRDEIISALKASGVSVPFGATKLQLVALAKESLG